MTATNAVCDLHSTEGGCRWCGKTLTGRQRQWCSRKCSRENRANHRWTDAKAAIKKEQAFYQCEHCESYVRAIEVNHIVPCRGKHGVWGCHHHRSNLQLLCKPCHKTETDQQRERGWT